MNQNKSKTKAKMYDSLPQEGKDRVNALREAFRVYFTSQKSAGEILLVSQEAISRYLSGVILIPLEVAMRFEEHTKGLVKAETIFFDHHAYEYLRKKEEKKRKTLV